MYFTYKIINCYNIEKKPLFVYNCNVGKILPNTLHNNFFSFNTTDKKKMTNIQGCKNMQTGSNVKKKKVALH